MPRRARRDDADDDAGEEFVGAEAGGAGAGAMAASVPVSSTMLSTAMRSVVRVYATHVKPNFAQPWSMKSPSKSTSSGFVIDGRIIVTNAHCVSYSTLIQVRKQGASAAAGIRGQRNDHARRLTGGGRANPTRHRPILSAAHDRAAPPSRAPAG